MSEPNLQARLSKLREQHQTKLQEIEQEYERSRARKTEIQDTIKQLRADLEDLRRTSQELEAEKEQEIQLHHDREADQVLEGLEASYATLVETQDYWIAKVRLRRQRQALIDEDTQLNQVLEDYKAFEQSRSDALRSVPPSYRQILIEEHENRTSRVSPYLDLVAMERGLACATPVIFQIILAYRLDDDRIGWIFPFRHDDELSAEAYAALCEVIWSLQREVINLGAEPGWFLDDVSIVTWAGFDALLMEGDYSGDGTPLESASHFLSDGASLDLFRRTDAKVLVAEMSREAWDAGNQQPEPDVSMPEPEESVDDGRGPSLAEITDGWYTEGDIVSWDRPLRVVSDSLWNVQARRLRTLLIRMIGKGKVGTESVAIERLWEDVPSPHKQNLKTGVGRLVEEELIVHTDSSSENGHNVTLNPERLEDVQDLINRDITQLWAGVIGSGA